MSKMESLKEDAEAVKQYGVDFGVALCRELVRRGAEGLHFYTLNSTQVVLPILDKLGYHKISRQEEEEKVLVAAV
ncbi:hypothetical protein EON64_17275 [archaeon]|nr:MAG: hypothetical protein EON64_17275 [archaeon]